MYFTQFVLLVLTKASSRKKKKKDRSRYQRIGEQSDFTRILLINNESIDACHFMGLNCHLQNVDIYLCTIIRKTNA